jgi:ATP-dependent helicase/nuclease subunit B
VAVKYIFGRSGMGKTRFIFSEIKQALENTDDDKLILLVPEQFTLQSERDLIEKLKLPGIMRIEVLSITRLTHKVINEVGGVTRTIINEQGKHMVLRKIIDESAKDLTIYKKASKQPGFVRMLSELICELKRHDVSHLDLKSLGEPQEGIIIHQKLKDISTIYERFNSYLTGRYMDTEDYINLFIEKIEGAGFLKGARVWIDGFNTFNPQTIKIITKIIALAEETSIAFTMGLAGDDRDDDLFMLSKLAYNKIHDAALNLGLKEEIINLSPRTPVYKSQEILHLEKEFFAYPYKRFTGEVNSIDLFAAANMNTEIENTAAQVLTLVRDRGMRFRDIAVVCNNMDSYGGLIKRVFDENGIPIFLDRKRDIMNNPIIELIMSVLDIIQRGYRYDDVFRFFKTGFGGLAPDEYEVLENYCLKYGIAGSKWKHEFSLGNENLHMLNKYREKFITPLEKLEKRIKNAKTFGEITSALYGYMEALGVRDMLSCWIDSLRNKELYEYANENASIWNIVLEIFDQMVEILGDQPVTVKEYKRVLESGFMSFEVGIIPATVDSVLVGDIQRSKSHDIKALFVIGVNDGVLPSGKGEEGILSDEEKIFLKQKGIDLESDQEIKAGEERFLIYSALAKPSDYLWISYALADTEGKAMRPSVLIDRFRKLFPGLKVKSDVVYIHETDLNMVTTPGGTFKHLVHNLCALRDGKPIGEFWWDVYGWYFNRREWDHRRESVIQGLFHKNSVPYIGRDKAKLLYKQPIRTSVSRLEQFTSCPFAHFVRYGLSPKEREMFEVGAPDMGELFHDCLLSFAEKLAQENLSWHELQKEQCDSTVDSIMEEIIPKHGDGVLLSTHRYRYLADRLKRITKRTVQILTDHIQRGDFNPVGYEVSFGEGRRFPPIEIELNGGDVVYLEGRIDRVDILEDDDGTYVKIIDYKSGYKNFCLSDVYYGLSLQLLVYLIAVLSGFHKDKLKPAGVFYFKIDDPLIRTEEMVLDAIQLELRKKFKMKGLVLKDAKIVRRLDKNFSGYSEIIPAGISKDGVFYKNSSALEENYFSALLRHVKELIRDSASRMLSGNIKIEPVKNGKNTACDFCAYGTICQFDSIFEDNTYKILKQLDDEDVIAKIAEGQKGVTADGELDA